MSKPFTCTRRIQFCAGHRVAGHENKCNNLHGHNYVAFITAQAHNLDNLGRVVDFSVLKDIIGGWIDDNWDHGLILWREDPLHDPIRDACQDGQKFYTLPSIASLSRSTQTARIWVDLQHRSASLGLVATCRGQPTMDASTGSTKPGSSLC